MAVAHAMLLAAAVLSQNLTDALRAAYADDERDDRFASSTVDDGQVGQPFRAVLPIGDGQVHGQNPTNGAFYAYYPETQRLEFHFSSESERTTGEREDGLTGLIYYPVFILDERIASGGSYVGQNAFGASVRVNVSRHYRDGVAILDAPGITDVRTMSRASYETKLTLSGPGAREVARDTVVELEGRLGRLDIGRLARCTSDYIGPTIDAPSEHTMHTCFVGAVVERVAFVRRSTGEVLQEWRIDNSPAEGPELWNRVRFGMNRKQFTAAFPNVEWPRYGIGFRIQDSGVKAEIDIRNDLVSSVRTEIRGQSPQSARAQMMAKYGSPVEDRCQYVDTTCNTTWQTPDGVRVRFSSIGSQYLTVTYDMATNRGY
ncbi:MAG: hypothetical protein H6916_03840 [Novosphingobium sp.]|uniref:hypothetical protein n=1 Tax=Novosphingobium sp. TaxID=1874826 RepID=UPI001D66C170|nr:hypothetical protein [Novosphingobium sp.]MCB2058736.1 hypothetical protein [Novosphingobium sp.]MCP5385933.1 hypothetical protein [Novosphingobium sp.]